MPTPLYPSRDDPDEVEDEFWLIVANNYLTDEAYRLQMQAAMLRDCEDDGA